MRPLRNLRPRMRGSGVSLNRHGLVALASSQWSRQTSAGSRCHFQPRPPPTAVSVFRRGCPPWRLGQSPLPNQSGGAPPHSKTWPTDKARCALCVLGVRRFLRRFGNSFEDGRMPELPWRLGQSPLPTLSWAPMSWAARVHTKPVG